MKDNSGVFATLKLELNLKNLEFEDASWGISNIKSTGLISLKAN